MKYFGEKSLSSFFSKVLPVIWYLVLILSVLGAIFGGYALFASAPEDVGEGILSQANYYLFIEMAKDEDWTDIRSLPAVVKMLFLPYFAAVVVFLLLIIRRFIELFRNFRKEILFNQDNLTILQKSGKLLIIFAILTFSISTFLAALILLLICEVFKRSKEMQDDLALTV